jgi:hypothetical protein
MKNPALPHIQEAIDQLTLEAYRGETLDDTVRVYNITIAHELRRVDCAIGPKGESMFARLADMIDAVFIELLAAKKELDTQK